MEVLTPDERTLTQLDHARLTNLVYRHKRVRPHSPSPKQIERLLGGAKVVPWRLVPACAVTMHSQVLIEHQASGEQIQMTLCYPPDADAISGHVSVLSALGWSLLGQRVGAIVDWTTPEGDTQSAEILEILFQPESSGVVAK